MTTQFTQPETAGYLDRNIKEVLAEFPAIGDVLGAYGIGCVTCVAGTCLLKEIVEYHYLPAEQQQEMMGRIAAIITSGGEAESSPSTGAVEETDGREIAFSPPMQRLVDEHTLIKRLLAAIPDLLAGIDLEREADREVIRQCVDFIRSYADRYHHAKEEDILFKRFDESQQIIRVMYEDHTTGRNHVRAMLEAVEHRDKAMLAEHMHGYRELLSEHIKKEDETLYPWMDRQMTFEQAADLLLEFNQVDRQITQGMVEKYTRFIEGLEQSVRGRQ